MACGRLTSCSRRNLADSEFFLVRVGQGLVGVVGLARGVTVNQERRCSVGVGVGRIRRRRWSDSASVIVHTYDVGDGVGRRRRCRR